MSLEKHAQSKKRKNRLGFGRILGRILLLLLVLVLMVALTVYALGALFCYGPSPTAREAFVRSVRETSAIGFIANLYLSPAEIEAIYAKTEEVYEPTDTSLITIAKPEDRDKTQPGEDQPDPKDDPFYDEDGDGISVIEIKGEAFNGYLMKIFDPHRVIMGSVPDSYYRRGYTVADMVEHFGAVAGLNAGGFEDPNGQGNGSVPDSLVVFEGQVYFAGSGCRSGFVGLDADGYLHVASRITTAEIEEKNIRYGVCFGPILISNGAMASEESLASGLNPRSAIGQCADGSILFLVIEGRQANSVGARLTDVAEILLEYGAVNALNLDGGSSSLLWYQGGYVNNCASVIGIRPVPTTFLVLPEEVTPHG